MKKRILSVFLALVLAAGLTVPSLAADTEPAAEGSFGGHRYEVYDIGMNWTEAFRFCQNKGGHLATITTEAEQAYLVSMLEDCTQSFYWLGANDETVEGDWRWVTGEQWDYENWSDPNPDNSGPENYLGICNIRKSWAERFEWNDFTDSGSVESLPSFGFVCEYENASAWARTEVQKAEELNLLPEILKDADLTQPITRAEFAAVAVKVFENLSGSKAVPVVVNPFTDTGDLEVMKAYQIGAVNGTSATTFTPNALLNREQCAAMLTRVFKRITLPGWTLDTDSRFRLDYVMPAPFADDADISDYARDSVYFMAANGIINGVGGNRFAPKNTTTAQEAQGYANATREQALAIAVRMVENLK